MVPFIFSAKDRGYSVNRVLQAADFRGELRRSRLLWLRAWRAFDQAQEQGAEPDEAILDKLAAEFRYARNLVTAEECEQWLAGLGLSADDFGEHIVRCSLAGVSDLFAGNVNEFLAGQASRADTPQPQESPTPPPLDDEQARCFRIDLVLSVGFQEMARALAWRVALNCVDAGSIDQGQVAAQRARWVDSRNSPGGKLENWPLQWEGVQGWPEELLELEARFQAESQALLAPENRRRALAALRLPLMRVDLEILELESEGAAREAFLCATEDGVSLEALATENRHALRTVKSFLEALPESWQQAVLSASPGTVLRPFQIGEGFQLCRLAAKSDPSLADTSVLSRVDASLLSTHFRELENRHIRWHVNLELEAS